MLHQKSKRKRPSAHRKATRRRCLILVITLLLSLLYLGYSALGESLVPRVLSMGDEGLGNPVLVAEQIASQELSRGTMAYPQYSPNWRIGFGIGGEAIEAYDVSPLCAGWYHDWDMRLSPGHPDGMDYIQTARIRPSVFDLDHPENYDWDGLDAKVAANPGSIWTIGNEPDGRSQGHCGDRSPEEYAEIYHIFYHHIKGVDDTAQISIGPIIQCTPVRMQWLDLTWAAYLSFYGTEMPIDVWNMHNQIVWEAPDTGADIPKGCDPELGMDYGIQDCDNMTIFTTHVRAMRTWMKEHGQQEKPLILSEYGVLQPEYEGFTVDRINEFMNRTFTYLLYAADPETGMPDDSYHLVQRWAWYSLNSDYWNGPLYDRTTKEILEPGRNFSRFACGGAFSTPTPTSYLPSPLSRREAEGGSLDNMPVEEIGSASDCRYILSQGIATYRVQIPNTDDYAVWVRGWGTDWANKSVKVQVAQYPSENVYFGETYWGWKRLLNDYHLYGGQWQQVQVSNRVGPTGARVDMIVVTSDLNYNPYNDPDLIQVCNPTETPTPTITLTPTITPTPTSTLTPTPTRTPMPTGPAKISGSVVYQGRGDPGGPTWQGALQVSAHLPGDPAPAYEFAVESDTQGHFIVPTGLFTGTYDVGVRDPHSLRNVRQDISVTTQTADLDMDTLIEGDTNLDDIVNIFDLSLVATCYGAQQGDGGYDARADVNEDDIINIFDLSLVATNYGESGDRVLASGVKSAGLLNAGLYAGTVTVYCDPSSKTLSIGQEYTVRIMAASGLDPVNGADVNMTVNPTYLEIKSATAGSALDWPLPLSFDPSAGTIHYVAVRTAPPGTVSGTFELFRMRLKAKQPIASTALHFGAVDMADPAPMTETKLDGSVTILSSSPTPESTQVPAPTATDPANPGAGELVLQQDLDGYTGFLDTYIDAWDIAENYSPDWELKLRNQDVKKVLLRADLTQLPGGVQLPPGTTIEEAVLTLYQTGGSDHTLYARVYGVLADWTVDEATWDYASQGTRWDADGCSGAGTDRDAVATSERDVFPTWRNYQYYPFDFDVTALVQRWVDAPTSNRGVIIVASEGTSSEYSFGSSDNDTQSIRPRLLIRYSTGPTPDYTATPTLTPTATVTPTPGGNGAVQGVAYVDLNGNATPDAGEPRVQDVTISLRSEEQSTINQSTLSGADGGYAFDGLAPGTYRLTVTDLPAGYGEIDPAAWFLPVDEDIWTINLALYRTDLPYGCSLPVIWRSGN